MAGCWWCHPGLCDVAAFTLIFQWLVLCFAPSHWVWAPRASKVPETLTPNCDSHCADVSLRFSQLSLVWLKKQQVLMKQVSLSSVCHPCWRICAATTRTISAALTLHSFCVVNPCVAAAVWHWETHVTAQRLFPPGRPVVSGPMDCVSLRSCWGTDHSACRR